MTRKISASSANGSQVDRSEKRKKPNDLRGKTKMAEKLIDV